MRAADSRPTSTTSARCSKGSTLSPRRCAASRDASRSSTSRPASTRACWSGSGAPSRRPAAEAVTARPALGGGQPRRASATAACARRSRTRRATWPPRTPWCTRSTSRVSAATARSPRPRSSEDLGRDTTNRESLGYFAHETGGRLFDNANDLGPALAEMLEMTSRYYVLGIQPDREKAPGRLPQAQGQGGAQGREALAPAGLLRARDQRGRADAAAAPVRPRRAGDDGRGPQRRAVHQPVPAVSGAGREADARPGAAGAARVAALEVQRAAGGSRSMATRSPRTAACATTWPRACGSTRRGPTRWARSMASRVFGTLRGPARPLHDPADGARRRKRQERASGCSTSPCRPTTRRSVFALPPLVLDESERWLKLDLARDKPAGPDADAAVPDRHPALRPAHELRGAPGRARAAGADGVRSRARRATRRPTSRSAPRSPRATGARSRRGGSTSSASSTTATAGAPSSSATCRRTSRPATTRSGSASARAAASRSRTHSCASARPHPSEPR